MITLLLAAIVAGSGTKGLSGGAFHCISTHDAYETPYDTIDYKGVRYGTCCAGCADQFLRQPDKMIAADIKEGGLFGESLFDVVSGQRISEKESKAHVDYKGTRYLFASEHDAAQFKGHEAKFAALPSKEALHCPVLGSNVPNIASAGGFVDFKGVRYYICCSDCLAKLKSDPAKYTAGVQAFVKPAAGEKNATNE